tara:strand:- start:1895 stop:2074 length:180 start_codon:yes stop_codon:yes gene_type:complete
MLLKKNDVNNATPKEKNIKIKFKKATSLTEEKEIKIIKVTTRGKKIFERWNLLVILEII